MGGQGIEIRRCPTSSILFAIAIGRRIVVEMILVMGFDIRDEQEKRVVTLRIDIANRSIRESITPITWQLDLLLVMIIEEGAISI